MARLTRPVDVAHCFGIQSGAPAQQPLSLCSRSITVRTFLWTPVTYSHGDMSFAGAPISRDQVRHGETLATANVDRLTE